MKSEIKNWKNNLNNINQKSYDYTRDNIFLKKIESKENIHLYYLWGSLDKNKAYYSNLFVNTDKFYQINKSIIKILENRIVKKNYKRIYSVYSFKSKNIVIKDLKRTDDIWIDDNKDSLEMYGKLINFDFNSLTNLDGYSYTHIQNKDNKSILNL